MMFILSKAANRAPQCAAYQDKQQIIDAATQMYAQSTSADSVWYEQTTAGALIKSELEASGCASVAEFTEETGSMGLLLFAEMPELTPLYRADYLLNIAFDAPIDQHYTLTPLDQFDAALAFLGYDMQMFHYFANADEALLASKSLDAECQQCMIEVVSPSA